MRISDWSSDVCSSDLNRNHLQVNPGSIAQELPGHDVGVLLHLGDHHLVARLQLAAIAVGYEVDGLGDVAGEHDLRVGAGVERARHSRAHHRSEAHTSELQQLHATPYTSFTSQTQ